MLRNTPHRDGRRSRPRLVRAAAIGLALSALLVALILFLRPAPEGGRPVVRPQAALADRPAATALAAAKASPADPPSPVRAALVHALPGLARDRARLAALEAGEVAPVAEGLAARDGPVAAGALFDLAALCTALAGAGATALDGAEQRATQIAGGAGAAARAVIDADIVVERAWRARFTRGCAEAALDDGKIRALLEAAGRAGDGASLERLARQDAAPLAHLQAAAVLGDPRAQYRMALWLQAGQPLGARAWLESAARGDADAEAYWGVCLLAGCFGAADPAAARLALESAARRGALYALGALSSAEGAGGPRRWAHADAPFVALMPRGPEALGLDAPASYAWSALAAGLARDGCFGFAFEAAAEALEGQVRDERALRPGELAAAHAAAADLEAEAGGAARQAMGCG